MPVLEQTAANAVAKYQSRTCTATFTTPTKPGSLIIVVCSAAGTLPSNIAISPGGGAFTLLAQPGLRDMQLMVWYRMSSPSMSSVSVTTLDGDKSLMVRALEYSGMAQASVLDKVVIRSGENDDPLTGTLGATTQPDELIVGFIANQYASTAQSGFTGGLAKLYESTSPQSWSRGWNQDWERSRLTIHQTTTTAPNLSFSLTCDLSTDRRWMAVLASFKGGSQGPAKFTSRNQGPMLITGGTGSLTVFGPLVSVNEGFARPMLTTGGHGAISPASYQYRLNGMAGLLIGSGTPFNVESTDGLNGWQIRTSDDDLPRGDGALRGIDLESARQVVFKLNVGAGRDEVERNMEILYRALIPQRDGDWPLIWRHPTQALRMMMVRPIDLVRERSSQQMLMSSQAFTLRAADPRHYSVTQYRVEIPVVPADVTDAVSVAVPVTNLGNVAAYPLITIEGPTSGPPVERVELVNATALSTFDVKLTLSSGSELVGDMSARVTGAPKSIVTLDGASKYGSWQLPRDPFQINPDPTGHGGFNLIYLQTTPPGAPVRCFLEYRDTWAG